MVQHSEMAQLCSADDGEIILERLEVASTFWRRFVGLQFRGSLPSGCGLLLAPCDSVHTCFCFFPLDVVFLSRDGVVLDVRTGVRPWRLVPPVKKARCVLETMAGQVAVAVGDQLAISVPAAMPVPKPLREFPCTTRGDEGEQQ